MSAIGVLFLFFLFLIQAQAQNFAHQPDCRLSWGKGAVKSEKSKCTLTAESTTDPLLIEWNLSKKMDNQTLLKFEIASKDILNLAGIDLRLQKKSGDKTFISYQLPLFSDPEFNWVQSDTLNTITLSLSHFLKGKKADGEYKVFSAFIRFKDTKKYSIEFKNLSVQQKKFFKKGRVSFTFDDGYISLLDAHRLIRRHGFVATAYVIQEALGTPGYISVDDLCKMAREGWMVGSHATQPFTEKTNLSGFIQKDFLAMKKQCSGSFVPEHLAFPLGKQNAKVLEDVKKVYKTARIASAGLETLPPAQNLKLRAFNVTAGTKPQDIALLAKEAVEQGDWLILMFHYLVPAKMPTNDLEYSFESFEILLKELAPIKKQVRTIKDVYNQII